MTLFKGREGAADYDSTEAVRPDPRPPREPGSIVHIKDTELRTGCGHSFATCAVGRCHRLVPAQQAERDRMINAARVEHTKNQVREDDRYAAELAHIEAVYAPRPEPAHVHGPDLPCNVMCPAHPNAKGHRS